MFLGNLMTPVGVSSRVTVVGGVEACRLAVWRWGRRSGYRRELVFGMIVLV
jgi:hypothetical protein